MPANNQNKLNEYGIMLDLTCHWGVILEPKDFVSKQQEDVLMGGTDCNTTVKTP